METLLLVLSLGKASELRNKIFYHSMLLRLYYVRKDNFSQHPQIFGDEAFLHAISEPDQDKELIANNAR